MFVERGLPDQILTRKGRGRPWKRARKSPPGGRRGNKPSNKKEGSCLWVGVRDIAAVAAPLERTGKNEEKTWKRHWRGQPEKMLRGRGAEMLGQGGRPTPIRGPMDRDEKGKSFPSPAKVARKKEDQRAGSKARDRKGALGEGSKGSQGGNPIRLDSF